MNVSKSALVDIMVGLGFPNAGNWSDDKMMEKVHQKLPVAFVTSKNLFSKEGLELAKTIVAAKRNGDTISITSDKAGKSEAKAEHEEHDGDEEEEEDVEEKEEDEAGAENKAADETLETLKQKALAKKHNSGITFGVNNNKKSVQTVKSG